MKVETSRCTGHCCKSFWLPVSPMELQHELKKFQLTGKTKWSEIEKIAPMVILQRTSRQCGHNSPKSKKVEYYYTCKHFDAASGNCTNYENRPAMCRDYPYGRQCSYRACTRREEYVAPAEVLETRSCGDCKGHGAISVETGVEHCGIKEKVEEPCGTCDTSGMVPKEVA